MQRLAKSSERLLPTTVFGLLAAFLAIDLAHDLAESEAWHVVIMIFGTAATLGGLALVLRWLKAARARGRELADTLERTRNEALTMRANASRMSGRGPLHH